MTDETRQSRGRTLAKRIEMIAWNLSAAREEEDRQAAKIVPIAETADTVTLRRSDYDAMRYAVFSK